MAQQEGFRPAGRQADYGRCALCGITSRLTKAHVPPKAAFNKDEFAWGGTTADNKLAYGRARLGGANRYAHCQTCRAATSPWDDEYIHWARSFAANLLSSPWKGQRSHISRKLSDVRPGRFIRSAIAGMTALTPHLIDTHPDLVRMVREGTAAQPPEDIRFLVGIAPDKTRPTVEGSHGATVVKMSRDGDSGEWTTAATPAISAVIHFPPFSLLLVDRQLVASSPHADATDFLKLGVDDKEEVSLTLPVIDLPRTSDAPVPISMLRFREATA